MQEQKILKGYKKTEIGIIPDDWEVKRMGEVANIKYGQGRKLLNEKRKVYPIIGTGGILGYGDKCLYNKTSLIIGRKGTINKPIFIDKPFWSVDTTFYFEFNSNSEPKFIYYKSLTINWKNYNEASGVPSLNLPTIKKIKISLPPLEEQQAIAQVLSNMDKLIEKLDKLIKKKKQIKKGAMQELLTGKKRLPGYSGEWVRKKLGDVADCLDNFRIPLSEKQREKMKGNIPYCGANGVLDYVNDYTIDDDIILLAEDGGNFFDFREKSIAYRMLGKCWVNNHAHILKAKSYFSQDYLFYSLVNKDITSYIVGGTRAKLNKSQMLNIVFRIPQTLEEQKAIAQILSDMDAEIESLQKKKEKYENIKKGAMELLLTGKIRLKNFNLQEV